MPQTDAELVALARNGDRRAFDVLVRRHGESARRAAVRMVGAGELAEELAQESLVQAFLSLSLLREESRFRAWLIGVVLNVCRSHLRSRRAALRTLVEIGGGVSRELLPGDPADDPWRGVEERELHARIVALVASLPAGERVAVQLFYFEQLSLWETAAALATSEGAVKVRLHGARCRLRRTLTADYPELERGAAAKRRVKRMVPVELAGVFQGAEGGHIVAVLDRAGKRAVAMWIGEVEAFEIVLGMRGKRTTRPSTVRLMADALQASGGTVEDVRVVKIEAGIFYGLLRVGNGRSVVELDARPSDLLGLASQVGCPIFVSEAVLSEAGAEVPEGREEDLIAILGEHYGRPLLGFQFPRAGA